MDKFAEQTKTLRGTTQLGLPALTVAVLFPGQGSQYVEMGKKLCEKSDIARKTFEEANDIAKYDIKKLCTEGSLNELCRFENMLTAILVTSVAFYRNFIAETGIVPAYLAGHSLGEYSALVCSGALNFSDAIKVVRLRSDLAKGVMKDQDATMSVIEEASLSFLQDKCINNSTSEEMVAISCYNSPNQFAISGHKKAVMRVEQEILRAGSKVTPFIMGPPFHSVLMTPIIEEMRGVLSKIKFNDFSYPVISNAYAQTYKSKDDIVDVLLAQLTMPVQWESTISSLSENVSLLVDIGPQSLIKNMVVNGASTIKVLAYNQETDREKIYKYTQQHSGINANVKYVSLVTKCLTASVCTRNQNWNKEQYEEGVIKPYQKIAAIQKKLDDDKRKETTQEMETCLDLLYKIFETKKIPEEEQIRRFKNILESTDAVNMFGDFVLRRYLVK